VNEWDRQELLRDLDLKEVHNYRSRACCGKPLIDIVFNENKSHLQTNLKPEDVCIKCALQQLNEKKN